jgi:hypothetical protein
VLSAAGKPTKSNINEGKLSMPYNPELQLLRELAHYVLPQLNCCFCSQPLMSRTEAESQGFGHRRHKALKLKITFHHLDENRSNNSITENIRPSHPLCHRRHHNAV